MTVSGLKKTVACALQRDLATLPQGDLTEVGEKGLQRQKSFFSLPLLIHRLRRDHCTF